MFSLNRQRGFALCLVWGVILCDQLTKHWVLAAFSPYLPNKITSFLNITLAFNSGAAFSLFDGPQAWHLWVFILFTVVVSIYLLVWLQRLQTKQTALSAALSLVLGGAMSNLYDRLTLGHVVDFIDVHYKLYHWPIFNLADSAICVGAVLLLFAVPASSAIAEPNEHPMCKQNCVTSFGAPLGQMNKTVAYSNCKDDYVSEVDHYVTETLPGQKLYSGMKWQCVEYARRWLIENRGLTFPQVENAYQIWSLAYAESIFTHEKIAWKKFPNKTSTEPPTIGDILIYDQGVGETGHVAVVVGNEYGTILLAEQNYFNLPWDGVGYSRRLMLMQDKIGQYTILDVGVIGWMRARA